LTKRVRSAEYLAWQRRVKAELYAKRRAYAIEFLGGCCAICGSTDRLEIDHKNRDEKSFPISRPPNEEAFRKELLKCQLLCYKHHRRKSSLEHRGEGHPLAKLTAEQVAYIRSHTLSSGAELARLFGVGPMQISRIRRGLRWKIEDN
jgi:5-methylcytosine-specific restriction endonuclease McrA